MGNEVPPPSAGDVRPRKPQQRFSRFHRRRCCKKKGEKKLQNEVWRLKIHWEDTLLTYCCVSHKTPFSPSTDLLTTSRSRTVAIKKKGTHIRCSAEFVKGLIAGLDGVTVMWHFTGFAFYKTGVIRFAMKAYQTFSWMAAGLQVNARRSHLQSVSARVECSSAGGGTAG